MATALPTFRLLVHSNHSVSTEAGAANGTASKGHTSHKGVAGAGRCSAQIPGGGESGYGITGATGGGSGSGAGGKPGGVNAGAPHAAPGSGSILSQQSRQTSQHAIVTVSRFLWTMPNHRYTPNSELAPVVSEESPGPLAHQTLSQNGHGYIGDIYDFSYQTS